MSDFKKVKFLANVTEAIKLKYDAPLTRDGKYGVQWTFGCEHYNKDPKVKAWEDSSFQPTFTLYKLLSYVGIEKGIGYKITKKQRPEDLKVCYWTVQKEGGSPVTDDDVAPDFEFHPPEPNAPTTQQSQSSAPQSRSNETVDDVIREYVYIWNALVPKIVNDGITPIDLRESVTTVFIECRRNGIKSAAKQIQNDFMGEEIPPGEPPMDDPSDLPF